MLVARDDCDVFRPLATWRRSSIRVAVGLTFAVAVLSIATGIANITTTTAFGPLARWIPQEVQRAAGFTGTLTGFVMLLSALGLRRGLRAAWYSAIVLFPVTALQGLVQSSQLSLPLIVLSVLGLPTLFAHRRHFDRAVSLTLSQIAAGAALVGVLIYGTAGSFALRDQFGGIDTLLDAFYYTLVTASTVGYGDVAPQGQVARLFGLSVVVLGTASFAVALGTLLGPVIEARLAAALGKMSTSDLELLDDHVILLGYGELSEPILEELTDGATEFVVVSSDASLVNSLGERGYNAVTGDPSDEETLERVGITDARAVVAATNNDGDDALAVLTARQLNSDVRIVASATERENVSKLERAGADTVISPAVIGGHLLVESALGHDEAAKQAEAVLAPEESGAD
jgi:voltage-gated potassium channel